MDSLQLTGRSLVWIIYISSFASLIQEKTSSLLKWHNLGRKSLLNHFNLPSFCRSSTHHCMQRPKTSSLQGTWSVSGNRKQFVGERSSLFAEQCICGIIFFSLYCFCSVSISATHNYHLI